MQFYNAAVRIETSAPTRIEKVRYQHLVGSGKGTLYSGGQAIALLWSRPKAADGTRWTYEDSGDPVVLPPGVIWWEIVPTGAGLTES